MLKFCYEFIDTDSKRCLYYDIDVACGKHYEWVLGVDRGPEITSEIMKEKDIADKVEKIVSRELFKSEKIPDEYQLHEICKSKKSKSVKVPYKPNMLNIKEKGKCSYKYCKGEMPKNWTDIYSYTSANIHCKYSSDNGELVPVAAKGNCHVSSDQYGGNYKEQKYRHKYHEASRALKKMRQ